MRDSSSGRAGVFQTPDASPILASRSSSNARGRGNAARMKTLHVKRYRRAQADCVSPESPAMILRSSSSGRMERCQRSDTGSNPVDRSKFGPVIANGKQLRLHRRNWSSILHRSTKQPGISVRIRTSTSAPWRKASAQRSSKGRIPARLIMAVMDQVAGRLSVKEDIVRFRVSLTAPSVAMVQRDRALAS